MPFDYATGGELNVVYGGVTRGEVPMRFTLTGSFTRYQNGGGGASIPSFGTNFTSAALRVGNRLLVATSNLQTAGSSPVYNPGTVLFFALDDSGATTTVTPASPFYAVTSDPNPLALTDLGGGRVAVTNAGISDASFPPLVTGKGSIDVLEAATGKLVGSFPLGLGNPGGRGLALDPTGSVAVAGSQTYRRLYAVDVRGIAALPQRRRPAPAAAVVQRRRGRQRGRRGVSAHARDPGRREPIVLRRRPARAASSRTCRRCASARPATSWWRPRSTTAGSRSPRSTRATSRQVCRCSRRASARRRPSPRPDPPE